jgi:hypothetical protein
MVAIDTTNDEVFAALRAFLLGVLPAGVEVMQTQDNRVPLPIPALGFVTMNNVHQRRLATNITRYATSTKAISVSTEYQIQLDLYGDTAGEWAQIVQTLLRDEYGTDAFPAHIQPLHADDPIQLPLINAEHQFEQRWKVQVFIQYDPIVTVASSSATMLQIGLKEIDKTFHP